MQSPSLDHKLGLRIYSISKLDQFSFFFFFTPQNKGIIKWLGVLFSPYMCDEMNTMLVGVLSQLQLQYFCAF